ncbi:MAG: hypothetical protein MK212_13095 [Saprospiraceae bacterium]|nr:hypothetical protein [Saprospiraceae bacterium]
MHNSKLLDLLRKMSSRELKRFSEYIHSPFFNKHKQTTELCDYLLKLAPSFNHPRKLQKEHIFKKIFPKRDSFDGVTFHRTSSLLLNLLHDFLVDTHWQQQKKERQVCLLKELRKRKAEKDYHLIAKRYKTEHSLPESHEDFYWNTFTYYSERDIHFVGNGGRTFDLNFQLANDQLDIFFIIKKLQIACDMTSRNTVFRADYKYPLVDEILAYVRTNKEIQLPIIMIYSTILDMLKTDSPKQATCYQKLKELLANNNHILSQDELQSVYAHALNFAIQQINRGNKEYYQEALDHYMFSVEHKLLSVDGYLLAMAYKNIVAIALTLEKYEWTQSFIEQYKDFLDPNIRENAYSYNLAYWYFALGKYGEALQTLQSVNFVKGEYYITSKTLQLKSYYELEESEALYSLIDAFESYIRRNKQLSMYRRVATSNMLKIAKRLQKLKDKQWTLKKEKLQEEKKKLFQKIKQTSPLSNKFWLEERLEKM